MHSPMYMYFLLYTSHVPHMHSPIHMHYQLIYNIYYIAAYKGGQTLWVEADAGLLVGLAVSKQSKKSRERFTFWTRSYLALFRAHHTQQTTISSSFEAKMMKNSVDRDLHRQDVTEIMRNDVAVSK